MKGHAFGLSVLLLAGILVNTGGALSNSAFAQDPSAKPAADTDAGPVGKVLTIVGNARIEHSAAVLVQANLPPTGDSRAKIGDLVYRGDTIQTGLDGELSVAFVDGSSFTVSRNARMVVDEFVYDPKGHSNSTLLNLTKGTFTFIAGNVAHTGDMKIETPVGTLGIRGTAPRVEILDDGTVRLSTLIEQK